MKAVHFEVGHRRTLWPQQLGIVACLALSACGYSMWVGSAPYGRHRLQILPFAEVEPNGISVPLAIALSRHVAAAGVRVTADDNEAQGVLTGTVHVANAPSATLRNVQIYAVVALVHAELRDRAGHLLWTRDVQLKDEFLPTDPASDLQPLVSEARRHTALGRLAEQAAYTVHEALIRDSHLSGLEGAS